MELLMREWGCGLRESNCPTKFVRVLHLVRHPLRVMQELMDKVCPGKKAKTAHPAFMQLAATYVDQNESQACLATVAKYVLSFNKALINARNLGHIQSVIQYETSTLCEIVDQAGFLDEFEVSYPRNLVKLSKICQSDNDHQAKKSVPDIVKNKRAQTAVSLTAIRDAVGPNFEADIPYGIIKGN